MTEKHETTSLAALADREGLGELAVRRPSVAGIERLHEQLLDMLRAEARSEASGEALRAEIRRLRSRIAEHRTELNSLATGLNDRTAASARHSRQQEGKTEILNEYRARCDALARRYASSEEAIRGKEARLQELRRERRCVEEEAVSLSRSVGQLADRVEEIRRAVVMRRLES